MLQKDLNLAANQLLPLFNKAIVKYTKLIKASYEKEVEMQMAQEEKAKPVAAALLKASEKMSVKLDKELEEGKGT